jgi:hypothetical protein
LLSCWFLGCSFKSMLGSRSSLISSLIWFKYLMNWMWFPLIPWYFIINMIQRQGTWSMILLRTTDPGTFLHVIFGCIMQILLTVSFSLGDRYSIIFFPDSVAGYTSHSVRGHKTTWNNYMDLDFLKKIEKLDLLFILHSLITYVAWLEIPYYY